MRSTARCSTSAGRSRSATSSWSALLIETAGTGAYRLVEWPPDKKAIDIGSFYADSTRFRTTTGWEPATTLRDGLARTIAYYREHLPRYLA